MPFKSEAQRRFMYAAEARGELPKGTAARWQKETGGKKLPEYTEKSAAWDAGATDAMAKIASDFSGSPRWVQEAAEGKRSKNIHFSRHKDGHSIPVTMREGQPVIARQRFFGLATESAPVSPQQLRAIKRRFKKMHRERE